MGPPPSVIRALDTVKERLERGEGVSVLERGDKKILRIEWLNLYNDPETLRGIAECVAWDSRRLGIGYDAVASIETSGAKYGVALALTVGKPYFSIHKVGKIVFIDPVVEESYSVTEAGTAKLYVDKPIVARFPRVLLVDDIRRSSTTVNVAARLLERAGSSVQACYTVLDLAFAGYPVPTRVLYRPLLVVRSVSGDRLAVSRGVCV